jgi:predicted permease
LILISLKKEEIKEYKIDLLVVAFWRFILSTVFYFCIVYFLHFDTYETEIRTILFIIITAPPAVFNVLFSVYFNLEKKFAAVSVATLTLISLALIPLIIWIGPLVF